MLRNVSPFSSTQIVISPVRVLPSWPAGADDIAQVEQLGHRPLVVQEIPAEPDLYGAAAIAQGDENQFADITKQDDAAGAPRPLAFLPVLEAGLDRFSRLGLLVTRSVGVDPQRRELLDLLLSLLLELVCLSLTRQRPAFRNRFTCQFITGASASISLAWTISRPTANCGSDSSVSSSVRFLYEPPCSSRAA